LPAAAGEFRDAKWVKTASGRLLVLARNNAPLSFYRFNVITSASSFSH